MPESDCYDHPEEWIDIDWQAEYAKLVRWLELWRHAHGALPMLEVKPVCNTLDGLEHTIDTFYHKLMLN